VKTLSRLTAVSLCDTGRPAAQQHWFALCHTAVRLCQERRLSDGKLNGNISQSDRQQGQLQCSALR
jgi:hypothetical protein